MPTTIPATAHTLKPRRGRRPAGRLGTDIKVYDEFVRAAADRPAFQYPAMMVSPMQGALLDDVLELRGGTGTVMDAFLGSAATLAEAASRGLPFIGRDINPLAVLLGQVASAEAAGLQMQASVAIVTDRARTWTGSLAAPDEPWCRKWFRRDVAQDLTALRASIAEQPDVRERRMLWAAMAEIVRVSGNHLAGAPKLQTRPSSALARPLDVIGAFATHARRLARQLEQRRDLYDAAGWYRRRNGRPDVDLACGDITLLPAPDRKADIVLTSPPYGDNHTTMPYGQVSFLPLRWMDLRDIDPHVDERLIAASKALDTASLGGSLRLDTDACDVTCRRSPTLAALRGDLRSAPPQAWKRTVGFFTDLDRAFARISDAAGDDAHFVMTLGEKTTYGQHIPMTQISCELLAGYGVVPIERLTRCIGRNKRLAPRNSFASTIGTETVLVAQRR